ncbi:response regulator transcription factor [Kribbella sp. NPDC058693]|uniref:helix-turn-helix transcriptional regulator n=1 Tax=Kribbella sp. NPDC058693 TaxID=3346602 RepID=UPI0036546E09
MEQLTVTERDLRRMLDVVDHQRWDSAGQEFPRDVLRALHELIPADDVTFQVSRPHDRVFIGLEELTSVPPGLDDDCDELFWRLFWRHKTCSRPQRTGDHESVWMTSDYLSMRQLVNSEAGLWDRMNGVRSEIVVPLPEHDGEDRRMLLFRTTGPGFSERERLMLQLLRPHLVEIRRDLERRRAGIPELTSRQWELLRLVAAGHTNTQIARRLFVAEGTVRKHLENIYERLGVNSRTAAVATAFPVAVSA